MRDLRRARAQLNADLKIFRRNPAALFFTAILPVIFLCLFVGIFGNQRLKEYDNVRGSTLQVPAFSGFVRRRWRPGSCSPGRSARRS